MRGQPPEYTPSQLENIKNERSKSTGSKASNEPETSTILQYETIETKLNPTKELELGLLHYDPNVTEEFHTKSNTGEVLDIELIEPEAEEPESELSQLE